MLLTSSIQIENRSNQNNLIRLAMRLSRYAGATPRTGRRGLSRDICAGRVSPRAVISSYLSGE